MSRERPYDQAALVCGCYLARGGGRTVTGAVVWGPWHIAEPCAAHTDRRHEPITLFEVAGTFEADGLAEALDYLAAYFAAERDGERLGDGRFRAIRVRPMTHLEPGRSHR
jgi:hypothetical protein